MLEKDEYHMISLMWNLRNKTDKRKKKEGREEANHKRLLPREQTEG